MSFVSIASVSITSNEYIWEEYGLRERQRRDEARRAWTLGVFCGTASRAPLGRVSFLTKSRSNEKADRPPHTSSLSKIEKYKTPFDFTYTTKCMMECLFFLALCVTDLFSGGRCCRPCSCPIGLSYGLSMSHKSYMSASRSTYHYRVPFAQPHL